MDDQFKTIPTERIVDPWVLLRPVAKGSIDYLEMRTSIGEIGLLSSIAVRPSKRKPDHFEVIDGMWRTSCMRDLGNPEIPCIVKHGITDDQVLALQIQANAIRPETTPTQFARQLKRIQKSRPDITLRQISSMVNKNPLWVRRQLGLLSLNKETQLSVDRGEICLSNAYMLSMLPSRLRGEYLDLSKTMKTTAFKALTATVIKTFKEAVKDGRMETFFESEFKPQAYLRSLKEVQAEVEHPSDAGLTLTSAKCKTAMDGWTEALKWALHLDKYSVEEQEHKARQRSRKKWKGE
jgi:ParB/RepB/Spo0J family partition protein